MLPVNKKAVMQLSVRISTHSVVVKVFLGKSMPDSFETVNMSVDGKLGSPNIEVKQRRVS